MTQDKLIVKGVAGLNDENPTEIVETKNVPADTMRVLAGQSWKIFTLLGHFKGGAITSENLKNHKLSLNDF